MTPSNSGDNPNPKPGSVEAQVGDTKTPIRYNLGAMLKENPHLYRVLKLSMANMGYLGLSLHAQVVFQFGHAVQLVAIDCLKAVDFSIRPPNPGLLMGGPLLEYYEEHPRLQSVSRTVPNTDGMETFNPSVRFTLLIIGQSYFIAESFVLRIENEDIFKEAMRANDKHRQENIENLKRGLDWMDKFRLH